MTNYYFLVSVYVTDLMIYSWLLKGAGKSLGCLSVLVTSDVLCFPLGLVIGLQADLDDLNLPTPQAKAT